MSEKPPAKAGSLQRTKSAVETSKLDKYDDTKKNLEKTGVPFQPRKRVKFDESKTGKDYINSGTFGAVYRCTIRGDKKKEVSKAVKIIKGASITNWLQICNELKLQNISEESPYVVELFTFSLDQDLNLWLIMEYCPTDLVKYTEEQVDLIRNKMCYSFRLDEIYDKVFQGLEFIHDNRIIHRDIKPENILMVIKTSTDGPEGLETVEEIPKICDFGIATQSSDEQDEMATALAKESLAAAQGLSQKTVIGTNLFMAGEMYSGEYDETVDIYALALSYFQCKTYTKERGEQHWQMQMITPLTMDMIKANQLVFSSTKNYKAWPQIICQATSSRPVERPSAQQCRERLENKYLALLSDTMRAMGLNPKKPNFKRKLFLYFGLPLIILAVVIAMVTIKCPDDKVTADPWKPRWFGGCLECPENQHLVRASQFSNVTKNYCKDNVCLCDHGHLDKILDVETGGHKNITALPCDSHKAQKCVGCDQGYHLEDDKEDSSQRKCLLNKCVCKEIVTDDNNDFRVVDIGIPTNGTDMHNDVTQCIADQVPACKSCKNGRYLMRINSYTSFCIKNQCKCSNGDPTEYEDCLFHGAEHCSACENDEDYYLEAADKNRTYGEILKNPEPPGLLQSLPAGKENILKWTGDLSKVVGVVSAEKIPAGAEVVTSYTSEYCVYRPDQCVCDNGDGTTAADCPANGEKNCKSCDTYYNHVLVGNHDVETSVKIYRCDKNRCKCDNGNVVDKCLSDGIQSCRSCDLHYYLDPAPFNETTPSECKDMGRTICKKNEARDFGGLGTFMPELGTFENCRDTTTELNLSGSSVREIPEFYFVDLVHLEKLRLARNSISKLEPRLFNTNSELVLLDLSHNFIKQLPNNLFKNNQKLEQLYLNNNEIKVLSADLFNNAPAEPVSNRKRREEERNKIIKTSLKRIHLFGNLLKDEDLNKISVAVAHQMEHFYVESDKVAICQCDNGLEEIDDSCSKDIEGGNPRKQFCKTCDAGYHKDLQTGEKCIENLCLCPFGRPNKGLNCPIDREHSCSECTEPFILDEELKICKYPIEKNHWFTFHTKVEPEICDSEILVTDFGNTLSERMDWSTANQACETIGGHLASIFSLDEQKIIEDQVYPNLVKLQAAAEKFKQEEDDYFDNPIKVLWIGLNSRKDDNSYGQFNWQGLDLDLKKRSSSFPFLNLGQDQPRDEGDCFYMAGGPEELNKFQPTSGPNTMLGAGLVLTNSTGPSAGNYTINSSTNNSTMNSSAGNSTINSPAGNTIIRDCSQCPCNNGPPNSQVNNNQFRINAPMSSLEPFKWYNNHCDLKAHFICQKRSCLEFPKQTNSVLDTNCRPSCNNGLAADKCLNNNAESCIACNIGYILDKKKFSCYRPSDYWAVHYYYTGPTPGKTEDFYFKNFDDGEEIDLKKKRKKRNADPNAIIRKMPWIQINFGSSRKSPIYFTHYKFEGDISNSWSITSYKRGYNTTQFDGGIDNIDNIHILAAENGEENVFNGKIRIDTEIIGYKEHPTSAIRSEISMVISVSKKNQIF